MTEEELIEIKSLIVGLGGITAFKTTNERVDKAVIILETELSKLRQGVVSVSVYCLEKNMKGEEYKCEQQCDSCKRMQDNWH